MESKFKNNLVIAILATSMSSAAALMPVLSDIAKIYEEYKNYVHLLLTIPPLMIMVSSMLVGSITKKITTKQTTIIGLLLIIISGVYPYFTDSFILLVLSRVIMGFGLGLITTISSSLPARYFNEGSDRDYATGLQSAFSSLGGVLFSFLSGYIASRYWRGVFLVQFLNILPLFVVLLYMKPNFEDKKEIDTDKKKEETSKVLVKEAILITVLAFLSVVVNATYPLNMSLFVEQESIGTSEFTGVIASINSFIGFIIGMSFSRINNRLKGYTLSVALFIVSLSFITSASSVGKASFLIGSTLFGIGTSLIYPGFLTAIYKNIKKEDILPAIGMYTVAVNIAQFVSPFIINNISLLLGEGIRYKFILASVIILILGVIILILTKKEKRA